MPVNVGSASVTIVPTMNGFSKGVREAFGSAGATAGSSFSKSATSGVSGVAKAFASSGKASGSGFSGGIATAEASVGGFSSRVAAAFGAAMGVAQSLTTKAFDAIRASIDSAVSRVDTMNNFPRVLAGLGYSADDASAAVKKMGDHLTGLPTKLDAMTSSVQKIVPTVKDVGKATDIMLAFNDALLAGGASTQVQDAALEQFTQVLAKGKPELEDWRSIQQAMPGQLDQVSKSILGASASSNDLYQAMKEGRVTVADLEDAFVALDTEGYAGFDSFSTQAKNGTAGIATSMSNLQNSVTKAAAAVIQAFGVENITAPVQTATQVIKQAGDDIAAGVTGAREWVGQFMRACQDNGAAQTLSDIMGALAEAGGSVSDAVGRVWDQLTGWLPDLTSSGDAADALKSALEAARQVVEPMCDVVKTLADNFEALEPAIVAAATAYAGFKVSSGIADAVASFNELRETASLALDCIRGGDEAFKTIANAASTLDGGAAETIGKIAAKASDLKAAATEAGGGIKGLSTALGMGPWGLVATGIAAVVAGLVWFFTQTEVGQRLWSQFTQFLGECWQTISQTASEVWGGICDFFAVDVPNAISGAIAWFQNLPTAIGEALSSAIASVGQWVSDLAAKAVEAGTSFLSNVVEFFQQLPGRVAAFLAKAIESIGQWVAETASQAAQAGSQFLSNVVGFFQQLPSRVQWQLTSAINHIVYFVTSVCQKASEAGQGFLDGVKGGFESAIEFIGSIPGKVRGFFSGVGTWLLDSGKALLNGFTEGIRRGFESAKNAVSGGLSKLRSFFPFSPAKRGPFSGHGYTTFSGRALMGGLGEGIADGARSAVSQARSALARVSDAMCGSAAIEASFSAPAPAAAAVSGSHGGATYNLYIDGASSRMDARMVSLVDEIVRHAELAGAM